jgi:hypothetical protein
MIKHLTVVTTSILCAMKITGITTVSWLSILAIFFTGAVLAFFLEAWLQEYYDQD